MVESIGSKYSTNIPSLSDNADIQSALRVYHYGQTSEPSSLISNSVAGHFKALEDTKVDIVPFSVLAGESLNSKTTTGYYTITTAALSGGTNYPPSAAAGMLQVIRDNDGNVFQQYFMTGTPNRLYWRSNFGSGWSSWVLASDSTHSHAEFTTYNAFATTKQNTITGAATTITDVNLDTNKVLVSDGSGKVRASADITTTELGHLNGTTGIVPSLAGTVGGDGTSKKIFIQSTQPTGTSPGDLWFW